MLRASARKFFELETPTEPELLAFRVAVDRVTKPSMIAEATRNARAQTRLARKLREVKEYF